MSRFLDLINGKPATPTSVVKVIVEKPKVRTVSRNKK
jgi:hypothetical protein